MTRRNDPAEIVRQLPSQISQRGRAEFGTTLKIYDGESRVACGGYSIGFTLEGHSAPLGITTRGLVATLRRPEHYAEIGNMPSLAFLQDAISLDRANAGALGLTSAKVVRARGYFDKGVIEPCGKEPGEFGLPSEIRIFHRMCEERKRYDPSQLIEAVWVLSGKPLLRFAQRYPGKMPPE